MDPLAHTLVGATLGETKLNRGTPLARATLMIAANLPDIDASCSVLGRDFSLGFRRGHTHGVLAMMIGPVILTGLIMLFDAKVRRPKGKPPVNPRGVLLLAYLGMITHPFLDWLNNYGIRLLMPFDDTWFYGDAVFIVDPWIWMMAGSTVFLKHSRTKKALARWITLSVLCSAVVLSTDLVGWPVKLVWLAGLATLIFFRRRGIDPKPAHAAAALGVLAVYLSTMIAGTVIARSQARNWYLENGIAVQSITVGPAPALPFSRSVIGKTEDRYYFASLDWTRTPILETSAPDLAIGDSPLARRALATFPGLKTWIRLPAFETVKVEDGREVRIRDVRYSRRGSRLGQAVVKVPDP